MSDLTLPQGWKQVTIGEVYRFTHKPKQIRYSEYEQIPFVPMELIPIGRRMFYDYILKPSSELTSGTYFEKGDILVSKITPSFENGKQGIIEDLPTPFGIATTEVIPLQAIAGISDRDFLFYYLLGTNVRYDLASKMEGTTGRQRLGKSTLEEYPLLFPPLPEQRAIAAALRAVQDAREARRRELALERERKAALMEELFTRGTRGEACKETEIGRMPQSWDVMRFGNSVDITKGQVDPKQEPYKSMLHVGSENIEAGTGRLLSLKTNGDLKVISGNYLFVEGNVLYSKIRPYMNKVALPSFSGTCSADMYPLSPHKGKMTREFLFHSILSEAFKVRAISFQDRTGIPKINRDQLNSIPLALPPLEEQQEIAEVLTACDQKIDALEAESALHDELVRALLEELMTGRIRAAFGEEESSA